MSAFQNSDRMVDVTPGDTAGSNFSLCEALWVGVAGTISVVDKSGVTHNTAAPSGLFPVKVIRVNSTGTAATNIMALY